MPIRFSDNLLSSLIPQENTNANKADKIAPNNNSALLLVWIPNIMKVPKPPPPIKAAKVAVPIIITIAIRNPDIIIGIANGNWTRNSLKRFDKPNASAASNNVGSIPVKPA